MAKVKQQVLISVCKCISFGIWPINNWQLLNSNYRLYLLRRYYSGGLTFTLLLFVGWFFFGLFCLFLFCFRDAITRRLWKGKYAKTRHQVLKNHLGGLTKRQAVPTFLYQKVTKRIPKKGKISNKGHYKNTLQVTTYPNIYQSVMKSDTYVPKLVLSLDDNCNVPHIGSALVHISCSSKTMYITCYPLLVFACLHMFYNPIISHRLCLV